MNELGNTPTDKNYKPSGISKAESRALEFYPMKDYNKEPNYIHSCDSKMLDEVYRQVFMLGYEQAEKDLALTWEDMAMITTFGSEVIGEHLFDNWTEQQIYEEVLTRFKQIKEAKQ